MNEPNANVIQDILDFLILLALSHEPMGSFSVEQNVEQRARRFFEVGPGLVEAALQRLERMGWLDAELHERENLFQEKIYSLTHAGKEQFEGDRERRASTLARFVEEGSGVVYEFGTVKPNSWN
jgi:DNA-binding PadR family transcriptional regulator